MIALVLALALAMPAAGLADDLSFHGHPVHGQSGGHGLALGQAGAVASDAHRAADPGLACHAHCGCHVGARPCEAEFTPPASSPRPRYARTRQTASSIAPDRLPRPPRA